jgi:hypothetical protein
MIGDIYLREPLLKGKDQYHWPPCSNQFGSAHFYIEIIIYLIYETSYPKEEVNCTEPFPSVSIPWLLHNRKMISSSIKVI